MKATELMIGDLLIYRGQHNVFDFRVEQITKRKVGYHAEPCESRMHYLRLHEVEPIPLTAEILERNGLPSSGKHYYVYDSPDDAKLVKIEFKYVHELQHALRMCNIDKDIELWK